MFACQFYVHIYHYIGSEASGNIVTTFFNLRCPLDNSTQFRRKKKKLRTKGAYILLASIVKIPQNTVSEKKNKKKKYRQSLQKERKKISHGHGVSVKSRTSPSFPTREKNRWRRSTHPLINGGCAKILTWPNDFGRKLESRCG